MTTLSLIQWMSQTTRLQAFVMLSCLVILVESFITPSQHIHRKIVVVGFHSGEEDMSWNSTANAMNEARTMSAMTSLSSFSVTPGASESRSNRFEHTVTHSTLDHWFHLLGGMEEERTSGKFSGSSGGRHKANHDRPGPPTASPTTGIPESTNKPTDHWML